ncbi:MAG: NAD(P)/FAD-dependent oxidoreductase [Saccharofermentans sp.]|nr:NAD(P)/FAD-dependent oxidoreductase [Saccharofermentans sp.]
MSKERVDVLIIGAGPAGLAAAISAKEHGIDSVLVLERENQPGGILKQCIHNGFGLRRFNEELTGPEYAQRDIDRANELGILIQCNTSVLSVSCDRKVTCVSVEYGFQVIECKAIILAMGCRERPRGAIGIPGTRCAGIYTAGAAQRFVNLEGYIPGKRIVILGSGDIGLIMARRLTLQGARVLACVEVMPYSSGLNRNIVQCLQDFNIPLLLNHTVVDIKGKERIGSVTVAKVNDLREPISGTEIEFDCDTLLISCGLIPENELSRGAGVVISPVTNGAIVNEKYETSVEGVFACGNVLHVHDLVDYVSSESYRAGKAASEYVMGECESDNMIIEVKDGYGVRGVVPQMIHKHVDDSVSLMFRPTKVFHNCEVVIKSDMETIYRKKVRVLTPGESSIIQMNSDIIMGINSKVITVDIE